MEDKTDCIWIWKNKEDKEQAEKLESRIKKKALEELYSEICTILNNLNDDLQMSKNKDDGYTTYEESYNAVKKYTLKLLNKRERAIKKKMLGLNQNIETKSQGEK